MQLRLALPAAFSACMISFAGAAQPRSSELCMYVCMLPLHELQNP